MYHSRRKNQVFFLPLSLSLSPSPTFLKTDRPHAHSNHTSPQCPRVWGCPMAKIIQSCRCLRNFESSTINSHIVFKISNIVIKVKTWFSVLCWDSLNSVIYTYMCVHTYIVIDTHFSKDTGWLVKCSCIKIYYTALDFWLQVQLERSLEVIIVSSPQLKQTEKFMSSSQIYPKSEVIRQGSGPTIGEIVKKMQRLTAPWTKNARKQCSGRKG